MLDLMKKETYIVPETEIIIFNSADVICTSGNNYDETTNKIVSLPDVKI